MDRREVDVRAMLEGEIGIANAIAVGGEDAPILSLPAPRGVGGYRGYGCCCY